MPVAHPSPTHTSIGGHLSRHGFLRSFSANSAPLRWDILSFPFFFPPQKLHYNAVFTKIRPKHALQCTFSPSYLPHLACTNKKADIRFLECRPLKGISYRNFLVCRSVALLKILLHNPSVKKMNAPVRKSRVARIVSYHANCGAAAVKLGHQFHYSFAVF